MPDGSLEIPAPLSVEDVDEVQRRIEFERSSHVTKWSTYVESNIAREQAWSEFAIDFGKFGIKVSTTLNGGAIFFIAAAFSFMGLPLPLVEYLALIAIFALGLICGIGALLSGFFACARRAESYDEVASMRASEINKSFSDAHEQYTAMILQKVYHPSEYKPPNPNDYENKANAYAFWRQFGIGLFFASLLLFISGTCYAAYIAYFLQFPVG